MTSLLQKLAIATTGSALSWLVMMQAPPAKAASFTYEQDGYNKLFSLEKVTGSLTGTFTGEDVNGDGVILGLNSNEIFSILKLNPLTSSLNNEVTEFSGIFTSTNPQDSFKLEGLGNPFLFGYVLNTKELYFLDVANSFGAGVSGNYGGAVVQISEQNLPSVSQLAPLLPNTASDIPSSLTTIAQTLGLEQSWLKIYVTTEPVKVSEVPVVSPAVVPEPEERAALLIFGLGGLGFMLKNKRAQSRVLS